ncbi:unnamed protein product [Candida verbasci]|uniref:MTHFR SAM-binding regulatory domain-containing protein n=1 Tax=Candida verbasci TaxID=1227364 RepID=A0A9W4XHI7_9ASCO|nr:unnamed protein product [Candida verbasci]
MSVKEKINNLKPNEKFISFEFFPPKTDSGFRNLMARLNRMQRLNPLFVTVTWGAGGSTSEKSLDLAATCQNEIGLTTVLHLTCTNTNKEIIDQALKKAKDVGIKNILALRGDPPRSEEYWTPNCDFNNAIDLVKYIKSNYGDYFCIGVAAYPEGHVDGSDSSGQNPKKDLPYLIEKVKAGADFIITQLFFDVDKYLLFEKMCKKELPDIPLIPGLMPITTYKVFTRAAKLSHASIPENIFKELEKVSNDDDAVKNLGVEILSNIINRLDSKGFHFYTLNLEKSIAMVLKKCNIEIAPKEIDECAIDYTNKDIVWDDFPNGRFGDSNSPAYGEIDGYGPNLKMSPSEAIGKWKFPQTVSDLTKLFSDYLSGSLDFLPWADSSLSPETALIQEQLFSLNEKGWFTVASQPAVNGCKSTDNIFGWGPKNGLIYQKSFVEMFIPKRDINKLKLDNCTYFLGDKDGIIKSSSKSTITWGVFPMKEIVQPTIIDHESFKAWNEEAFLLWLQWARCYKKGSKSYNLLNSIYNNYYLISIVHHDFPDELALWNLLL